MAIIFHEDDADPDARMAEHSATCDKPTHVAYQYGVYDRWGQLVNAYTSQTCWEHPFDLALSLAEHAGLWPGCRIAGWLDRTVRLPAKLADGPQPDAITD